MMMFKMPEKNFMWIFFGGALMILALFVIMSTTSPSFPSGMPGAPYSPQPPASVVATPSTIAIMDAQNNSGQAGALAITEVEGGLKVEVSVAAGAVGVSQPAHLHSGTCATLGAVVYPLNPVVNGASETVLQVATSELNAKMPLALNVHKSASEPNVYVSCGDASPLQ